MILKILPYLKIIFISFNLLQQSAQASVQSCTLLFSTPSISKPPLEVTPQDTSHRSDLVLMSSLGHTTYTTNRPLGFIAPSLSQPFFYRKKNSSGFRKYSYLESLNKLEPQDVVINLGTGQFLEALVFASKTPWSILNSQNREFSIKKPGHISTDILNITKALHELEVSNKNQLFTPELLLAELITKHPEFTTFDPQTNQQILQPHLAEYVIGLQKMFQKSTEEKPQFVGISYENLLTDSHSLSSKQHYLTDRFFQDISLSELKSFGPVRLAIDIFGVTHYSSHHDQLLHKMLSLLELNGEIFIITGNNYRVFKTPPQSSEHARQAIKSEEGIFFWQYMSNKVEGAEISIAYSDVDISLVHIKKTSSKFKIPQLEQLFHSTEKAPMTYYLHPLRDRDTQ